MTADGLRAALRNQSVEESARMLLGARIIALDIAIQVVEAEAYHDERDPGSHAWRGQTPLTALMFGDAGHAYVYFTYGCHWMLNVTCRPVGEAGAVLIRAAKPIEGIKQLRANRGRVVRDSELMSGPGKLASALALSSQLNGVDLLDPQSSLRLEKGADVKEIWVGVRVGLAANRGADVPWRFIDRTHAEWSSRPRPR